MIKTVLLVPVRDNQGGRFQPILRRELETRLIAFGGFNRLAGVEGAWESEGLVYRDRCYQYTVSLGSWTQLHAWLEIVHWARQAFRQRAIYIEVAGVPEILE